MTPDLSILCVTAAEPWARPFVWTLSALASGLHAQLVVVPHGSAAVLRLIEWGVRPSGMVDGECRYLEAYLDDALALCNGRYVLRIDDDERCSPAMVAWLAMREYAVGDHWKFPRMHLWPNDQSALMTPQLFPDHQTRLSVRAKAGGRRTPHAMSPFGGGALAPAAIFHYKFLARTRAERARQAAVYDAYRPGYGTGGMLAFSLPEDAYDRAPVAAVGDGNVPWTPAWNQTVAMNGWTA